MTGFGTAPDGPQSDDDIGAAILVSPELYVGIAVVVDEVDQGQQDAFCFSGVIRGKGKGVRVQLHPDNTTKLRNQPNSGCWPVQRQ